MKKFLSEFRDFAMRGNVMDMAVGVIIGAAFGKIVTSLVSDIIMPVIGLFVGGVNFTDWKISLGEQNSLNYGNFIQVVFDFIIVAFCIFAVIKAMNKISSMRKKQEEEEPKKDPEPTKEEILLTEIRDLLKNGK